MQGAEEVGEVVDQPVAAGDREPGDVLAGHPAGDQPRVGVAAVRGTEQYRLGDGHRQLGGEHPDPLRLVDDEVGSRRPPRQPDDVVVAEPPDLVVPPGGDVPQRQRGEVRTARRETGGEQSPDDVLVDRHVGVGRAHARDATGPPRSDPAGSDREQTDPVRPTPAEVAATLPGDDEVPDATVVMDRAATLDAVPEQVWPWLVQLGKRRAGWYLPAPVERLVPRRRRALRDLDPRWQRLAVGDVVPDYGGADATFTVAALEAPQHLVLVSTRGHVRLSWALVLTPTTTPTGDGTRLHLRLRMAGVRRPWLADTLGGAVDLLTVAGMVAGLRERLAARLSPPTPAPTARAGCPRPAPWRRRRASAVLSRKNSGFCTPA